MKAIVTKYHGPGNFRGSRISASDGDGNRVILHYDDRESADLNHEAAARALCMRLGWHGTLVNGTLMHAGRIQAEVWVWRENGKRRANEITV